MAMSSASLPPVVTRMSLRFKRSARIIGADGLEQGGDAQRGIRHRQARHASGLNEASKAGGVWIGLADIQLVDTDASLLCSDRVSGYGWEIGHSHLGTGRLLITPLVN